MKKRHKKRARVAILLVLVGCLGPVSCSSPDKGGSDEAFLRNYPTVRKNGKAYKVVPNEDILMRENIVAAGAPNGDPVSIRINISKRRAWLYKNGQLAHTAVICPGKPGFETPTGNFQVVSKHRDWVSTLYHVPMPFFLRLNADGGRVGLHAGAIALDPASHGCIRLPAKMAEVFFSETPVGTKVLVEEETPGPVEGSGAGGG